MKKVILMSMLILTVGCNLRPDVCVKRPSSNMELDFVELKSEYEQGRVSFSFKLWNGSIDEQLLKNWNYYKDSGNSNVEVVLVSKVNAKDEYRFGDWISFSNAIMDPFELVLKPNEFYLFQFHHEFLCPAGDYYIYAQLMDRTGHDNIKTTTREIRLLPSDAKPYQHSKIMQWK